jgi:hypothetical protein
MIEGYVGLIGGGKSLNATDRMMRYMASGGVVYTNMTLIRHPWYNQRYAHSMKEFKLDFVPLGSYWSLSGMRYVFDETGLCLCRIDEAGFAWANSCGFEAYLEDKFNWQYQKGQYNKLSNDDLQGELHALIPCGTPDKPVLCVLDEAVDFFDTDDRGKANREFLSFLRHSRKQSVDLIFIAQDFTELNKRIRNQTHFIWTFWDMQSFKIPGLRSTLPPPWKNMILCQQWNRNMTGGVLKRVWKPRDIGLFGCYRTDELFRALKSADGKTDFSGEGKIIQGEFRMKPLEKVALFACLLFSGLQFFSGGKNHQVESSAGGSAASAIPAKEDVFIPETTVLYGTFQRMRVNGNWKSYRVDGIEYIPGQMTTAGTVLAVTDNHVHIRDDRGNDTFIYQQHDVWDPEPDKSIPRPENADDGTASVSGYQET